MLFLVYPLFIAAIFTLLVGLAYRRPGPINSVFDEFRRPARLKNAVRLWFVVLITMFLWVQWIRLPFFRYVLERVIHLEHGFAGLLEGVHTIGLLLLGLCEVTVVIHWIIYLIYCWIGTSRYRLPETPPLRGQAPAVVVLIASCDEEPEILSRSLSSAGKLRWPNLRVYLLENSRKPAKKKEALDLAREYGIESLDIVNRGHKAGALNDGMKLLGSGYEYLAVLDADQKVIPEFLEDIVPILENDPRLAFVQTPQLYDNAEARRTTRAAAMQEMMLYDSVMEGKGAREIALCCGSNFVMRRSALESIGGWDENSVSEDLCTSFLLHRTGWKSLYARKAYAIGLGPNTLNAYWKQQRRWATGNTTVAGIVLKKMFAKNKAGKSALLDLEYLWSAGYYVTTLALAVLATLPMLLLMLVRLAGLGSHWLVQPAVRPIEWVYLSVYPLYAAIMMFPYIHMHLRGYSLRNLLMLQGLLSITIPVYVVSVLKGILRRSTLFEIVPKVDDGGRMPLWRAPQSYVFAALLAIGGVLMETVITMRVAAFVWVVLFWALLYAVSYGHFFLFAREGMTASDAKKAQTVR